MATHADTSLGGWLAGILVEAIVFGILTVQTYTYYCNYPKDRISTKTVVALLILFQFFYLPCFSYAIYSMLVTSLASPRTVTSTESGVSNWQFVTFVEVALASSVLVQSFLVKRIYGMKSSIILSLFIETVVLSQFALGIVVAVKANMPISFEAFENKNKHLVLAWLILQASADVLISASMVFLLNRSRTGFERTDTIINRLALYSVGTGITTCLIAIIVVTGFAAERFSFLVDVLSVPFGGLYSLTMLANLNNRLDQRTAASDGARLKMASSQDIGERQTQTEQPPTIGSDVVLIKLPYNRLEAAATRGEEASL